MRKTSRYVVLGSLAAGGALALGVLTRIIHVGEEVNALWLVAAAACIFILAYRFYASFLAAKVLALDDGRPTPAHALRDGRDYHPTNKWVLFGHHFAAIAGAGPLIGPVLAAQFGYLPGVLWILVGAVFAGAVHDFVILTFSIRRGGKSLAEIARDEIGPVGGAVAALAVLIIIVIALAGLGLVVVNALYRSPWGTWTIAATIPIALFMGLYMYRLRPGKVAEASALGVALLVAAVAAGPYIRDSAWGHFFNYDKGALTAALAGYGFVASVLPVWMLLCPRDYLSTYMKVGTVALLAVGVIFMRPTIHMPAVTAFIHGGGPVLPYKLYPFMFITIACGAISGFHSLVASGTTPKMINAESEAKMIGYGAMLVEGFVSVMALVAATALLPGDYFAINTTLGADALTALGFAPRRIGELSALVGVDVAGRPGGAVSLAVGMASIFSALPGMKRLMAYWYNFALMFEALFILTTVDTGTRVARFIVQEIAGKVHRPFGRTSWLPGTFAASAVVVGAWGLLIHTGTVKTIWPMFGTANQLLAGLALVVGTTVLLKSGKVKYAWTTAVPAAFMLVTTLTASFKLLTEYLNKTLAAASTRESGVYALNGVLVAVIAILAVILIVDAGRVWVKTAAQNGIKNNRR